MRRIAFAMLAAAALLAMSPRDASAQMTMGSFQGYLTGHVGMIAGDVLTNEKLEVGASVAVQEERGWGAEIDFGHTSDVAAGKQILDVTSYLVNAAWVKPGGLVRPFFVAGGGVLQVDGCDSPCSIPARTYDFGMSAGGGVYLALNEVAGLRADARYFFTAADHPDLNRPNNFSYWRMTIGATFMWSILP